MLFAAITAAAISHFSRMTDQSQVQTRGDRVKSDRDKLRRRLQAIASLDDAIFLSSEKEIQPNQYVNPELRVCVNYNYQSPPPPPAPVCDAMNVTDPLNAPMAMKPLILYSPESNTPLTSPDPLPSLAGKYNHRGEPCTLAVDCEFHARAWFWLECDSSLGATCQTKEYTVRTLVQVKTIADLDPDGKVRIHALLKNRATKTGDIPKTSELFSGNISNDVKKRRDWSNKVALAHIIQNRTPCPPGFVARGSTEQGVRCEAMGTAGKCTSVQLFTGINSRGEPKCEPIGKGGRCDNPANAPVQWACSLSGCRQLNGIAVNCGTDPVTGWPKRLTQFVDQFQGCRVVSGPGKKSQPGDVGQLICTINYSYQCCT